MRLKEYLHLKKIKQADILRGTKINMTRLNRFLNNVDSLSDSQMIELARFLNLPPEYVVLRTVTMEKQNE